MRSSWTVNYDNAHAYLQRKPWLCRSFVQFTCFDISYVWQQLWWTASTHNNGTRIVRHSYTYYTHSEDLDVHLYLRCILGVSPRIWCYFLVRCIAVLSHVPMCEKIWSKCVNKSSSHRISWRNVDFEVSKVRSKWTPIQEPYLNLPSNYKVV